jgi:hypothetical protein
MYLMRGPASPHTPPPPLLLLLLPLLLPPPPPPQLLLNKSRARRAALWADSTLSAAPKRKDRGSAQLNQHNRNLAMRGRDAEQSSPNIARRRQKSGMERRAGLLCGGGGGGTFRCAKRGSGGDETF